MTDSGLLRYAEGVVGDVVAAEVAAELQAVRALGPGEIVDELVLGYVASLGEQRTDRHPCWCSPTAPIDSSVGNTELAPSVWVKIAR